MNLWNTIGQAKDGLRKIGTYATVTIGNFDGVHRGHQAIIRRTIELAKEKGDLAVAVTFVNHTGSMVGEKPLLINSLRVRRELLIKQGIDALLEIEFDNKMSQLEPEDFFRDWLVDGLRARELIIGYDFKYGKQGRGDFELLKRLGALYNVNIEQIPPVLTDGEVISSSRIRRLLLAGELERANKMLGYPFMIEGDVAHGEKRGRSLGFPTLNIYRAAEYILPWYGVYLVRVIFNGQLFFGLANVGTKPTFGSYSPLTEVYLLDADIDLYGENIRVEFLKFIRKEERFATAAELKNQIERDIQKAKEALPEYQT